MKYSYLFLVSVGLLTFAACSDKNDAEIADESEEYVLLNEVTATIQPRMVSETGSTRGVVQDLSDNSYYWEPGGSIVVVPQAEAAVRSYTITSDMVADSSVLKIPSSVWRYKTGLSYYAVYPYFADSLFTISDNDCYYYTMPEQVQSGNGSTSHITPELDPLVSEPASPSDRTLSFSMKHMFMLVKFQLVCSEDVTYHSLDLKQEESKIFYYSSGLFLMGQDSYPYLYGSISPVSSDGIRLSFDEPVSVTAEDTLDAYMLVPPFIIKNYSQQNVHLVLEATVTQQEDIYTATADLGTWSYEPNTLKVFFSDMTVQH